MLKKVTKLISLFIMLALLASAFSGLTACSDEKDENVIVIGAIVTLSGDMSYYGKDMLQSYQLAVEEINAAGGVLGKQLKLFDVDDAGKENTATAAAARIISEGVDFVVGGYASGVIIPTMQLFYDEGLLLLISNANSTNITAAGFNQSFMINSPGSHAVITLTSLLKYLGSQKIALIHQGTDYTKNLSDMCAAELPKSGFEIATVQVMDEGAQDVSAIVTAINNSGADFVYWCGYHADGSNVIKQLRRGGYAGAICVGDGSASPDLIEACGTDGEGVYVTSPPYVKLAEGGEKFITDFKAKFGDDVEPGPYATLSYDTIYLLKAAIEIAGTTEMAKVRDAVQNIEYKGLSGTIKFTSNREPLLSNFIVMKIQDGGFVLVTP